MVSPRRKPSLREASCCSVDVVKGGVGLRLWLPRSIPSTMNSASRIRAAARSAASAVSTASLLSSFPSRRFSRAVKGMPLPAAMSASTVQYSFGVKASISLSRSQISRSATDCTRPAERLPGSLRHRIGDNP